MQQANSYAGRYNGYYDRESEELIITGECDEEYAAALTDAREVAQIAARSNAYRILRAQGRTDETAQLVYEARVGIDNAH